MTVAILGTGDMGSAVAACLVDDGQRVITCLDGRSERSRKLAANAGIRDVDSLRQLAADAEIFLSIMPPAEALQFARAFCPLVEASGKDMLFVDCNAVSPATSGEIALIAHGHGVRFQDGGIVGTAPRAGRKPVRLYTSGEYQDDVARLSTGLIDVKPLGPDIGRASALKMVYASLTKGTHALRAAAMMAGEALGVGDEIREEWRSSLPDAYQAMQSRMPKLPAVSSRWAGEMREIAATYNAAGLTPAFHEGAEWIYELLANADVDTSGEIEDTLASFMEALEKR